MTNYAKTVKKKGSNPLQHSTRSFSNLSFATKMESVGEMDKCRIAWSRFGNKHADALMSYDSDNNDDDHNQVRQHCRQSHKSAFYISGVQITLAMHIAM